MRLATPLPAVIFGGERVVLIQRRDVRGEHALRDRHANVVAAAVSGTAHGISIAPLLPPAAVEAARWRVMRAVAVASHAALLIVAAWVHLCEDVVLLGDPTVGGGGAVGGGCGCLLQQRRLDGVGLGARLGNLARPRVQCGGDKQQRAASIPRWHEHPRPGDDSREQLRNVCIAKGRKKLPELELPGGSLSVTARARDGEGSRPAESRPK